MERRIPCLDLKRQHQEIKKEVFEAFEKVYENTAFSGGSFVEAFEKDFATFCQTTYAVGLNNGTSAVHLGMLALGIGPGDEVIVPANTFIATAWGVSYTGAAPVFIDCDPLTWEIDPLKIEAAITPKTKAVVGVHLYGQPFDIHSVQAICKKHNLFMVEDAAQAQGATFHGVPVGGFGEIGCFSFYPGKNLGACGEAGGITTNNKRYYDHLLSLRNHGSIERYYHDEIGYNMRMGGLEAASLSIKLRYLPASNQRRKEIALKYQTQIKNSSIRMQVQPEGHESVFHLFVITTDDRTQLIKFLNGRNIFPGLHYPVPCHLQKAYAHLGYKNDDCPYAEYLAGHCLSLPMYAELTDEEVEYVINAINQY